MSFVLTTQTINVLFRQRNKQQKQKSILPRSYNEAIKTIPRLGKVRHLSKQSHSYPFAQHLQQEKRVDDFFHDV